MNGQMYVGVWGTGFVKMQQLGGGGAHVVRLWSDVVAASAL